MTAAEPPDDLDLCLAEDMRDPAFRGGYEDAGARRRIIRDLTALRRQAGLSQQDVAAAMGTT